MSKSAIIVQDVSKAFRLPHEKHSSLKGLALNIFKKRKSYEVQKVLKNVSFEVKEGEFLGIVGRNGSGKSTLLKLLAGIYSPDTGAVAVNGKLTPFIELGVGFNQDLTGRENVFLNGALLGFTRKEMEAMYDEIVFFAELEKFMDQKLKNYSSGMQVRLAFSIAIKAQAEILILDEVLAVGDAAFQRKCYDYFMSLKKNNKTVVLVTHDMGAVRQYCDRAVMIDKGQIVETGKPEKVAQAYQKLFSENTEKKEQPKTTKLDRWGDGDIISLPPKIKINESSINLTTKFLAKKDTERPVFGFTLIGPNGVNILEGNTLKSEVDIVNMPAGSEYTISWSIPNILSTGNYTVSIACCDQSTTRFYDWVNEAITFNINKKFATAGVVDPEIKVANYRLSSEDDNV